MNTATYSPEDNKLRLYASARLDKETYERVRKAGFIWAPKQGIFVAPMWTPGREDLCIELAGDIEDEDKSLVERAEERSERFGEYSHNRAQDASQAAEAVKAITSNIPFGQPILVGHHSERHARKDAERIENGMRKAVRMWETSEYWKQRAEGAIRHASYKERPDVRARRIKKIEAEKRKCEKNRKEAQMWLRLWSGIPDSLKKKDGTVPTMHEAAVYLANYSHVNIAVGIDGTQQYSAWDVLRSDEERYSNCPSMTPEQVREKVMPSYERGIAWNDRWITHFENRLTYERAMLGESGGTETDKTAPQVGGGCLSWVGWREIQKVNKVTVSVLDNWGNGGRDFIRTVEFDKLKKVVSPEEWKRIKEHGEEKKPESRTVQPVQEQPKPNDIEAMREQLKAGVSIHVVTADQLFETPQEIIEKMIDYANIENTHEVLEPSAGTGLILKAIGEKPITTAVEVSKDLADHLSRMALADTVVHADFLECNGNLGKFDRVLMNPPFKNGIDIKHIEHAFGMLKPGGRLVAICANGPRQRAAFMDRAEHWEDLPECTFKEAGTNVNTALFVLQKESSSVL